jgi:hypothetical protein
MRRMNCKTSFSIHGHRGAEVWNRYRYCNLYKTEYDLYPDPNSFDPAKLHTWSQVNKVYLKPYWYTILRVLHLTVVSGFYTRVADPRGFVPDLGPNIFIPDPGSYI